MNSLMKGISDTAITEKVRIVVTTEQTDSNGFRNVNKTCTNVNALELSNSNGYTFLDG